MRPTIPAAEDAAVVDFCARLCPGSTPCRLPVTPVAHARALDCFAAVRRHVKAYGGEAVYGWQLWLFPELFLDAEFHAVWKGPSGRLHDITPKQETVEEIIFVPDPLREFSGSRVKNVRVALKDDPRVGEFLQACDDEWNLLNRGSRVRQPRFELTPWERLEWETIAARKREAARVLGFAVS